MPVFLVTLWDNGVQLVIFQSSGKSSSDPNYIKFVSTDQFDDWFSNISLEATVLVQANLMKSVEILGLTLEKQDCVPGRWVCLYVHKWTATLRSILNSVIT